MENSTSAKRNRLYAGGLALIFIVSFSYIFDSKLDLNGDNCNYFMLATSLVQGHGYANLMSADYTPSNLFPPGYPLLMSIVRLFTDSIFPQKILNGLFLLGSSLLLFFFIRRNKLSDSVAFVAAAAMLLNYQVLHFATMMMSEMSFLFTSVLTCWFLAKMDEKKAFWRDPFFYLVVVTAAFNYHIRTQGIALFAAVAGYFLFTRRWKEMLGFIAGFAVCLSPWMLRNNLLGLGQSRYLDMIASANNWRPEEGVLGFGEIIGRFFDTFRMLLTKALPNSVLPYMDVNYDVRMVRSTCAARPYRRRDVAARQVQIPVPFLHDCHIRRHFAFQHAQREPLYDTVASILGSKPIDRLIHGLVRRNPKAENSQRFPGMDTCFILFVLLLPQDAGAKSNQQNGLSAQLSALFQNSGRGTQAVATRNRGLFPKTGTVLYV